MNWTLMCLGAWRSVIWLYAIIAACKCQNFSTTVLLDYDVYPTFSGKCLSSHICVILVLLLYAVVVFPSAFAIYVHHQVDVIP